jgi:hypothetical protein
MYMYSTRDSIATYLLWKGPSWSWSCGSWVCNYMCHQCLFRWCIVCCVFFYLTCMQSFLSVDLFLIHLFLWKTREMLCWYNLLIILSVTITCQIEFDWLVLVLPWRQIPNNNFNSNCVNYAKLYVVNRQFSPLRLI